MLSKYNLPQIILDWFMYKKVLVRTSSTRVSLLVSLK